jgi:hypothetical protein
MQHHGHWRARILLALVADFDAAGRAGQDDIRHGRQISAALQK